MRFLLDGLPFFPSTDFSLGNLFKEKPHPPLPPWPGLEIASFLLQICPLREAFFTAANTEDPFPLLHGGRFFVQFFSFFFLYFFFEARPRKRTYSGFPPYSAAAVLVRPQGSYPFFSLNPRPSPMSILPPFFSRYSDHLFAWPLLGEPLPRNDPPLSRGSRRTSFR